MALTASAQSALPFSWDETIVPALRKRLESESRMLAKRMSTASITSQDEAYPHLPNLDGARNAIPSGRNGPTPRTTNGQPKQATNGNASLTHQRTDTTGSTSSHVDARGPKRRARTYSQPPIYDGPLPNGHPPESNGVVLNGLPTPDTSRSTSPSHQQQAQGRVSDVKPTRIPVVSRNRTPSESSHGTQHGRSIDTSRNVPYLPQPGGELSSVEESLASNRSRSAVTGQRPGIMNEPAPAKPDSMKSNVSIRREQPPAAEDETEPRPSADSEERPFEHWYRGDVRRNGGVGELRVGGKQEMLDIANYGHRYGMMHKPSTVGPASFRTTPSTEDFATRRNRAGSFTEGDGRGSFYMDEERARALDNVLHEDPLTDIEGDGDQDMNYSHDYVVASPILPMPSSSPDDHRSVTPTNNQSIERERNAPQTRIPGPAPRQSSEPPRTQTPAGEPHISGSEPAPLPSSSSSATANASGRAQSSRSQSTSPSQPQTQKRRAKSPAAPSASKKAKQASKSPARSKADQEKNRRSVANYPQLTGDNVVDAIPSWTQPVPADGNWDEVVLPVVARKRGLDGHYAQADGRAQSKEPESEPIEPAPGTFAYDNSKHRPREINGIPMYEFRQRPQDIDIPEVEEDQAQPGRAWNDDTRPAYVRSQRSPLPSPHHANKGKESIPKIRITQPTFDMEQQQGKEKDDAGCCKCVIM